MLANLRFSIPLPSHLPMRRVIAAAFVLLVLQLLSGTELIFAQLIFLFVVLAGLTANLLGGIRTLPGFCLTMIALKLVLVSQVAKVVFWEAADHNLKQPRTTAAVLVLGLTSVLMAALVIARLKTRRVLFQGKVNLDYLQRASWIAFIIFLIASPGYLLVGTGDGYVQIGGIAGLMKRLIPCGGIAVVAGTAHAILASDGKRCLSGLNLRPLLVMFLFGMYGASKEGMISPFMYFGLTAAAFRFRLGSTHLLALLGFALFLNFVLFPFGQVARNQIRGYGFAGTVTEIGSFSSEYLTSLKGFRSLYRRSHEGLEDSNMNVYFDRPIDVLERMSLIKPCDSLVDATLELGESRWETIMPAFESLLPASIFWRPYKNSSNYLGIKSGMISEDNEGTSISFGFIADSFSSFRWLGTALIPFALCLLLFGVTQCLTGPMEQNIWWAYFCGLYFHQVAEYNISGIFTLATYQNLWYLVPALLVHCTAVLSAQARLLRPGFSPAHD